jgi:1,4-dihydroxy-2-naphthoate octaprenyltransferase
MGARGLGELNVALSFFLLVFASFYVATVDLSNADSIVFGIDVFGLDVLTLASGTFSWEIFVFAVIVGTLVGMMRLIDSLTGHDAHVANGEKNIAVRVGILNTVKIAKVLIVFVYLMAIVMVLFNPVFVLLFLTLPLALKAWRTVTEKKEFWMFRAPPLFFGNAFLTELLFVISIVIIRIFGITSLFL